MIFAWMGLSKPTYKFTGVLQRIALCYFFSSIIILNFGKKGQIRWLISILGLHYILLKWVTFPGHEAGILVRFENIADWFDTKILGVHMA